MKDKTALLVIDLQNDYFPGGKFPLWNANDCKMKIVHVIAAARKAEMPVILIQHIAENNMAPFFNENTPGAEIISDVRSAVPDAPVVIKHSADAFLRTDLEAVLQKRCVTRLLICGMMTQNCVTFTALSKEAEKYRPGILSDCCTTVSEILHLIALNALSTRVELTVSENIGKY